MKYRRYIDTTYPVVILTNSGSSPPFATSVGYTSLVAGNLCNIIYLAPASIVPVNLHLCRKLGRRNNNP